MKKTIRIWLLALIFVWPLSMPATAQQPIGTIKGTKGLVTVLRDGRQLPAKPYVNAPIYAQDVILTGSDGAVGILLKDNTLLSMGPISRLEMSKFTFEPAKNQYAMRLHMYEGSFVYQSGLLGKLAPHAVELDTPAGRISMLKQANFMARFGKSANKPATNSPQSAKPVLLR